MAMRRLRRAAGRAASGLAVAGMLLTGIATCARIGRVIDRGSDVARAASHAGRAGGAAPRLGRVGRGLNGLDDLAAVSRTAARPARHASARELEELARVEGELRRSGWREGVDALRTADHLRKALGLLASDERVTPLGGRAAAEESRRATLLHSRSAELRLAALTIGADDGVDEQLLDDAALLLDDPDPRVRIAAARLIGDHALPVSCGAFLLSGAAETETDPEVRDAFRRADAKVWERFRAMRAERRAAQR